MFVFSAKIPLLKIFYLPVFEMSAAFILTYLVMKTFFGILPLIVSQGFLRLSDVLQFLRDHFYVAVLHKNLNSVQ